METGSVNGNKTTITIKDAFTEASVARVCHNLEDTLFMIEDCLRALGFSFKGSLTIDEGDDE